jgi:hypothetical protein
VWLHVLASPLEGQPMTLATIAFGLLLAVGLLLAARAVARVEL